MGAVSDKLKKSLQNLPSFLEKYEPLKPGDYSINGNKGIYDCFFKNKNGYGYKFQINCEQLPFPKGITPKAETLKYFKKMIKEKKINTLFQYFKDLAKTFDNIEKISQRLKKIKDIKLFRKDKEEKQIKIMKNTNHHQKN